MNAKVECVRVQSVPEEESDGRVLRSVQCRSAGVAVLDLQTLGSVGLQKRVLRC
jgi:protein subunit release factor A